MGADGLPFIRDLRYCGGDIIDNLAKDDGEGIDQALRGFSETDSQADIDQACKGLICDINETLTYYATHHDGGASKHVYVCGGFSLFDDCVKVLADGIDSEVSIWNPFSRISCDDNIAGSELIRDNGAAFVVAAGLAMRKV